MANKFKGYLLRNTAVGIIPNKFLQANGYSCTPNQRSDRNTYVDEEGVLHRDILPATSTKIEFETVPMNLNQKIQFQKFFPNRTVVELEYWNDETNDYEIGKFYVPDIPYSYYAVWGNDIRYNPFRVAFIEYGKKGA